MTYAKFGSFFCDCGAKDDGSCQASVRRPPQPDEESKPAEDDRASSSTGGGGASRAVTYAPYRVEMDNADRHTEELTEKRKILTKQLEPYLDELLNAMTSSNLIQNISEILKWLFPMIDHAAAYLSPVGSMQRARKTIQLLHDDVCKSIVASESLMIPTLGSQEGAFENVRMSFTGDQVKPINYDADIHLNLISLCCWNW